MTHAHILAQPSFRLLLVPFGGPIGKAGAPRGVDLDGEWFSPRTDVGAGFFREIPCLWHHGDDPALGATRLGSAVLDSKPTGDGWMATVTWAKDEPAVNLVRALARRVEIFGSSQPLNRGVRKDRKTGEILAWHVAEATLSTSPQNTYARVAA